MAGGNILGIIVPTADRNFFSSVVRGIEEIANGSHYNVMICQTYDNYEKEIATVEALLKRRCGMGLSPHMPKELLISVIFRK